MTAINLTGRTDDQLSDLLNDVLAEQERRQRLKTIPDQIATLAQQYVDGGGDKAVIESAVSDV